MQRRWKYFRSPRVVSTQTCWLKRRIMGLEQTRQGLIAEVERWDTGFPFLRTLMQRKQLSPGGIEPSGCWPSKGSTCGEARPKESAAWRDVSGGLAPFQPDPVGGNYLSDISIPSGNERGGIRNRETRS